MPQGVLDGGGGSVGLGVLLGGGGFVGRGVFVPLGVFVGRGVDVGGTGVDVGPIRVGVVCTVELGRGVGVREPLSVGVR